MHHTLSLITISLLTLAAPAKAADDGRLYVEASLAVSYLIAGGTPSRAARVQAPATGGAALVPTVRLAYAHAVADPYVTVSPIVVTPYSLDAVGLVGAVDVGVAWHLDSRAWSLGTGATAAPTYMRFCNGAPWCLREWTMLFGGELHASGRITEDEDGRGVSWTIAGRIFRGAPVAWIYPRLTDEQRDVSRWSVMFGGLATYRF